MIVLGLAALSSASAEPFQTSAPTALLTDEATGATLLAKNADGPVEPAAMAKLMTVTVVADALADGTISLDTSFPVSESAWRKGGGPSGAASMFVLLKSRVAVGNLLRGVAVQAGNDASLVLAEGLAGSEEAFVGRMNAAAKALGLKATVYRNATGFADPAQTTTARDLAALLRNLIRTHPDVYALYGEKDFLWNRIRQRNRNPLLTSVEGTDGGVTGASDGAGFGLAASAQRGGRRLILVVHGLKSAKERAEEARRILEWGFSSFGLKPLFAAGETVGEVRVFGGARLAVPVATDAAIAVPVRTDVKDALTARIAYDGPIPAPVKAGTPVARLEVMRDGAVVLEAPLRAASDVPVGGLTDRAFGALFEMGAGLIHRGELRL